MKSWIEEYLGFTPAAPGEGTAWNWSFISPWPADWPTGIGWVTLVALLLFIVVLSGREVRRLTWRFRCWFQINRLLLISVVLAGLCRVSLSVERTGLPLLVVLLDDSASMQIEDEYRSTRINREIRRLVGSKPSGPVNRNRLLKALLLSDDLDMIRTLMRRHKLKIYRFARSAQPIGRDEYHSGSDLVEIRNLIEQLDSREDGTRPGPAIAQVLEELRGTPPSALVLMTDGVATESMAERSSQVVPLARESRVPIFCVGLGSAEPRRDVELQDVILDDVAVVGSTVTVRGKLRNHGFEGKSISVVVRNNASRAALARTEVELGDSGTAEAFQIEFGVDEPGEFDFQIEAAPQEQEADTQNNRVIRHLSVRQARIRVLLADGMPRYEFRYLKHLLERIAQRDSTIELHTVLQDGDPGYAQQDLSGQALEGRFPVSTEQLFEYDVILLGDVDPELLGTTTLGNLREFVAEQGGGLVIIAGSRFMPHQLVGSPLDDMLPVEPVRNRPAESGVFSESFVAQWTVPGKNLTPLFRRIADGGRETADWNLAPGMFWSVPAMRLRAGAVVLLERIPGSSGPAAEPLVTLHQYARGKVVFQATDELWRWRFRQGDELTERYWLGLIQYLSRSRLLGRDRSAELTTDRLIYEEGDDVVVRVRFLDERVRSEDGDRVLVVFERDGSQRRQLELSPVVGDSLLWETTLSNAGPGSYHGVILSPPFDEAPPSCDFRIERSRSEFRDRVLARTDLRRAAELSGGQYFDLHDVERLPDKLPRGSAVSLGTTEHRRLWNRWELLACFALLVVFDQVLRRRYQLK